MSAIRLAVLALAPVLAALGSSPAPAAGAAGPALPRAHVETAGITSTGTTRTVRAGGDLQAALDSAQPGDEIVLDAGAVFVGPFTLPAKPGSDWITVRSNAPDSQLPPPGVRANPSVAGSMPKLESASAPVLTAAPGAHHFRFVGIEVRPRPGAFLLNLVLLGSDETAADQVPHHVVFERCYLHGDASRGSRRGIALNGAELAVVDSYVSDFKEAGADSQALAGWNGPGPIRIENNYLEGAGENVLFGGADPAIRGLVPSDIEILRNWIAKPLAWKSGEAGYAGTRWSVKNLLELKNARRVHVAGNVLENNWAESQSGFAVLFTPRNQDGHAPWSVVEDVTFEGNVLRHSGAAFNIMGHDDLQHSAQTREIAIRNCLVEDVGGERWGGNGTLLQMLWGTANVTVEHVTSLHSGNVTTAEGDPHTGFVFRDSIVLHNQYGFDGAGTAPGRASLDTYFPGGVVRRNVIVGGSAAPLPSDNFTPATLDDVGFVAWRTGDYRLKDGSRYRKVATDGGDAGVDWGALTAAQGSPAPAAPEPRAPAHDPGGGSGGGAWAMSSFTGRHATRLAALALWASAVVLAYTHAGYPILVGVWARLRRRRVYKRPILPDVTVLVVVHDEAARVGRRLENLLALDYPRDKLEIILASDGSTDATVCRAQAYDAQGVRVVAFPVWRGKPSVLNDLVRRCRGEIVVFADARQAFDTGALRALVAPFADPRVGAVSGALVLAGDPDVRTVGAGVGLYWRLETSIRAAESAIDSTVGVTGAIYALRRELFEPLRPDTLLDDVVVPIHVVRQGFRVVFEPLARALDRPARSASEELARKARTIAGCFQLFSRERWLLDPFRNRLWLQTVSHKALRLLTPLLLGTALAANLWLADARPYRLLLAGQAAFYAEALLGFALGASRRRSPLLSVPCVLCLLAWATVLGFFRFMAGQQSVAWEKASPATSR